MGNKTLERFIRRTIYNLKRQYGDRVDVYKLLSSVTNHLTGEKTVVKQVHSVYRAPVMPYRIKRAVNQTISIISAGKDFVYGGFYDAAKREILIDARDLPQGYEIRPEDYVVYNGERWDVVAAERFEIDAGWVLDVKHLPGQPAYQINEILVSSDLAFTEEVSDDPLLLKVKAELGLAPDLFVVRIPFTGGNESQINLSQSAIFTVE